MKRTINGLVLNKGSAAENAEEREEGKGRTVRAVRRKRSDRTRKYGALNSSGDCILPL